MKLLNLGIDVGSTTVKIVILDEKSKLVFAKYERHFSDTLKTIKNLVKEILETYPGANFRVTFTGSGALDLAGFIDLPFVQEVIACKTAVTNYDKDIDVAIELGGEDAKIIYFGNSIEQRMNGSCAGGTGAFLDQMATLLNTDTNGLNELAKKGETIYPIASRCGVFAKTDVQPLLNEGAKPEDIALSILQAVVNQTISGLACGKPIRGKVMFLGGPLNYLSELRNRFIKTLNLSDETTSIPEDAHLFVCTGAIYENIDGKTITHNELEKKINNLSKFTVEDSSVLTALFKNKKEYDEFTKRHNKNNVTYNNLKDYSGDAFLGIDAGSTTCKLILIDKNGNLLHTAYQNNMGKPIDSIKEMLIKLYEEKPEDVIIRMSGSTGYGEHLIKTAFNLDESEIETMAHYRAASAFAPIVDSIIDIGGQDMKYIRVKNGTVNTIMLNEACSSGCGSFIETLVKSLNMQIDDFAKLAIKSKKPVDLGSRCTVFMNSKIKQTQKEGRSLEDIFAGLSYSIVKNALLKVMKIRDFEELGETILVQGGTFYNDAILRAFEIVTEKEVIKTNIAGMMGAYGMALLSKDKYLNSNDKNYSSTIIKMDEVTNLEVKTNHARCKLCENNCGLTINFFRDKRFVSGNRCERGSGESFSAQTLPNMYKYKYDKLFNRHSLALEDAPKGEIGIPRALNMYEDYPFWHTLFTELGFRVVLSDKSTRKLYESGMDSMPSESVCFPAKLVHGHIMNLIEKEVKTIFYPCIVFNEKEYDKADNSYNCPIVTSYPEAIKLNVEEIKEKNIKFMNPFLPIEADKLLKRLSELSEFKEYNLTKKELKRAIKLAHETRKLVQDDIATKGDEVLQEIIDKNEKAIVLVGRPYHLDHGINHGIDTMINHLGYAVLIEEAFCFKNDIEENLRIVDQWTYHSRLYRVANEVAKTNNIELIQLNSFGCGLDAIVNEQVEEILKLNNKLYTSIKIDEISSLGAARIRVRSLLAAMKERTTESTFKGYSYQKLPFTQEMKERHTLLAPDLSPYHFPLLGAALKGSGYNVAYLQECNEHMVEEGLKYVNNDACYPALIVIGQLISALKSGEYDLNSTSVIISQTGGGCRATNYIGLLRKAMVDAGFGNVPIVSFNASGLEKGSGFKFTLPMINRLVQSVVYGDLLIKLFNATVSYEKEKGLAKKAYDKWMDICVKSLNNAKFKEYKDNIRNIINEFNNIEVNLKDIPKVAVVGEILIKYHSFGNNNLVEQLQKEGTEVFLAEFMGFVKYHCYNAIIREKLLKTSKKVAYINRKVLDIINWYEKPVKKGLENTRFMPLTDIHSLAKNVETVLSTGNQTGEGWFLTGEILELVSKGVNNVVCVQPFACLPNHVVGKAVIKRIKEIHENANIIAIDYDPGASHSNQINRIKLMLSIAKNQKPK